MSLRPSQSEPWMAHAVCASVDPELWFPPKLGSSAPAKRICNGFRGTPPCPVRQECLEYALTHDDRFGVWGGMSERERSKLRPRSEPLPEPRVPSFTHPRRSRIGH